ncbi:hypothetical protein C8J56DRAFT_344125 [Mycena floridula]|nr:hypothetical protein C8J56DRAFT_344125 [Mycena floridula]
MNLVQINRATKEWEGYPAHIRRTVNSVSSSSLGSIFHLCGSLTSVASWWRSQPLSSIPHTKALDFIFGPSRIALTNTGTNSPHILSSVCVGFTVDSWTRPRLDYSTSRLGHRSHSGQRKNNHNYLGQQHQARGRSTLKFRGAARTGASKDERRARKMVVPRQDIRTNHIFGFLSSFSYLLFSPLSTVLAVWHPKSLTFLAKHYMIPPKYTTFLGPTNSLLQ